MRLKKAEFVGKMERVDQNLYRHAKSGMFYVRVMHRGVSRTKSLRTREERLARQKMPLVLERIMRSLSENDFREAEALTYERSVDCTRRTTFADAAERLRVQYANDPTKSKSTKVSVDFGIKVFEKTWAGDLTKTTLRELTPDAIRDWYAAAYDVYGGSPSTLNAALTRLRQVGDVMCERDAQAGVAVPKRNPFHVLKMLKGAKRVTVPERATLAKALEVSLEKWPDLHEALVFLAYTGARIGEASVTTWADIDLERNRVTIWNAKRRVTSGGPSHRTVPLAEGLRVRLEKKKRTMYPRDRDPIFEKAVITLREKMSALWRDPAMKGHRKFTFHDMRHLFATRCLESGVDVPTVAKWLGHVDGGVTLLKTYSHLMDDHSQSAMQKVKF